MNFGLTERQMEVLAFVKETVRESGMAPSYEEIAAAFDVSKGNAHALVTKLVDRGYLIKVPGAARSLQITVTCCPNCGHVLEPVVAALEANGVAHLPRKVVAA